MIRFILDNAVDITSTLFTSQEITSEYVVDNLKKISRLRVMRSENAEDQFVIAGIFPEEIPVSAMVIARHNFSSSITYQLKLYNDLFQEVHDSGIINVTEDEAAIDLYEWGEFNWGAITWGADKKDEDNREFYDLVYWKSDGVPVDTFFFSLTLDIGEIGTNNIYCNTVNIYCDDASVFCDQIYGAGGGGEPGVSSMPYFEIGRLYIGEYLEPTYNISLGHGLSPKEDTSQYRSSSGTLRSDFATTNRSFEFSLKTIPEADREVLHNKLISKGKKDDFYISIFPEHKSFDKEIDYSGLVKFTKIPQYTEFINNYYKSDYMVEEI